METMEVGERRHGTELRRLSSDLYTASMDPIRGTTSGGAAVPGYTPSLLQGLEEGSVPGPCISPTSLAPISPFWVMPLHGSSAGDGGDASESSSCSYYDSSSGGSASIDELDLTGSMDSTTSLSMSDSTDSGTPSSSLRRRRMQLTFSLPESETSSGNVPYKAYKAQRSHSSPAHRRRSSRKISRAVMVNEVAVVPASHEQPAAQPNRSPLSGNEAPARAGDAELGHHEAADVVKGAGGGRRRKGHRPPRGVGAASQVDRTESRGDAVGAPPQVPAWAPVTGSNPAPQRSAPASPRTAPPSVGPGDATAEPPSHQPTASPTNATFMSMEAPDTRSSGAPFLSADTTTAAGSPATPWPGSEPGPESHVSLGSAPVHRSSLPPLIPLGHSPLSLVEDSDPLGSTVGPMDNLSDMANSTALPPLCVGGPSSRSSSPGSGSHAGSGGPDLLAIGGGGKLPPGAYAADGANRVVPFHAIDPLNPVVRELARTESSYAGVPLSVPVTDVLGWSPQATHGIGGRIDRPVPSTFCVMGADPFIAPGPLMVSMSCHVGHVTPRGAPFVPSTLMPCALDSHIVSQDISNGHMNAMPSHLSRRPSRGVVDLSRTAFLAHGLVTSPSGLLRRSWDPEGAGGHTPTVDDPPAADEAAEGAEAGGAHSAVADDLASSRLGVSPVRPSRGRRGLPALSSMVMAYPSEESSASDSLTSVHHTTSPGAAGPLFSSRPSFLEVPEESHTEVTSPVPKVSPLSNSPPAWGAAYPAEISPQLFCGPSGVWAERQEASEAEAGGPQRRPSHCPIRATGRHTLGFSLPMPCQSPHLANLGSFIAAVGDSSTSVGSLTLPLWQAREAPGNTSMFTAPQETSSQTSYPWLEVVGRQAEGAVGEPQRRLSHLDMKKLWKASGSHSGDSSTPTIPHGGADGGPAKSPPASNRGSDEPVDVVTTPRHLGY